MKKIKIITNILGALLLITSCSSDNKLIDDVFENVERGAVLRTLNSTNTYNFFDPNDATFKFDLSFEAQDIKNGELLSEVRVYQTFSDNTEDGVENSKTEALFLTVPKSEFGTSDFGFPSYSLSSVTLAQALSISGLSQGQYFGGDSFLYRLELELTDGRVFSNNAGGTVAGGSYFSSPFQYNVVIKCIPVTPFAGDYELNLADSYGDGWDGAFITVTIDGVSTDYTVDDGAATKHNFTVPVGTTELTFTYTAGSFEEEHSYEITGPFGEIAASDGPSPGTGTILLNICN